MPLLLEICRSEYHLEDVDYIHGGEKSEKKNVRSLWQYRVKASPFLTCLS